MQKNNNFDILRLVASLGVFFEHGSFIFDKHIFGFFNNNYSFASLFVFVFFFISGHLVFQSWRRSQNILNFLAKRFFRIFPGLFCASIFSVFVIGLWVTNVDGDDFLKSSAVWITFLNYATALSVRHQLPGVFESNPFPFVVNASLWTIKYEILMYFLLVVFIAIFGERKQRFIFIFLLSIFLFFITPDFFFFNNLFSSKDFFRFEVIFLSGVLCVFFIFNKKYYLLLFIFGFLLSCFGESFHLVTLGVFIWLPALVVGLAYFKPLTAIKLPFDLSYGIYIYAFPIQQAMTELSLQNGWDKWVCLFISLILVAAVSWASWIFVEEPVIKWSRLKFGKSHD